MKQKREKSSHVSPTKFTGIIEFSARQPSIPGFENAQGCRLLILVTG